MIVSREVNGVVICAISTALYHGSSLSAQNREPIELTPTDVGSTQASYFEVSPTADPQLFFGAAYGTNVPGLNFNTAPDGALSEGGTVNTKYASKGLLINNVRISASIYGGNRYGDGFVVENDFPQIYSFSPPVVAVGIANTSPDKDFIEVFSGPNATGELLLSFRDQEDMPTNFDVDRFVGGRALNGVTIGSFRISNASGNLELDELIFAVFATAVLPPEIRIEAPGEGSGVLVTFTGILQARGEDGSFKEVNPQPVSRFHIPEPSGSQLFRARGDTH